MFRCPDGGSTKAHQSLLLLLFHSSSRGTLQTYTWPLHH